MISHCESLNNITLEQWTRFMFPHPVNTRVKLTAAFPGDLNPLLYVNLFRRTKFLTDVLRVKLLIQDVRSLTKSKYSGCSK